MSLSSPLGNPDIIESAVSLFCRNPSGSAPAAKVASHQQAHENAKHRHAMALRLDQLNAALGEDKASQAPQLITPTNQSGHKHGTAKLILAFVLSALLGAGMMWMAGASDNKSPGAATTAQQRLTMSPAATPANAPVPGVVPKPELSDKQAVDALLEKWRNAWEQRDTASYLGAYSKDFVPSDGSTLKAWVAGRQKKLSKAAGIEVQVSKLVIERLDDKQFKATFLQDYTSGHYRETGRAKTLHIAREDGAWKITREWQDQ